MRAGSVFPARFAFLALATGCLIGSPASGAAEEAGTRPAAEYLWVVRTALLSPSDCDRMVGRAVSLGVRGLLVQVVGRGDSFYRSDLLPRAEALPPGDFDPLGYLLPRAHDAGLQVHAWMNCFLVWSAPQPPRDSAHVVWRHPDWLTWGRDPALAPAQRRRASGRGRAQGTQMSVPGGEGFFLAAARPEARTFLAQVAAEIASRYPVDGIHLDYVRYPSAQVSMDSLTRAEFARFRGADSLADSLLARQAPPSPKDSLWQSFRREQVTRFVSEVRDTLSRVRPGLSLSTAVMADLRDARTGYGQDWVHWLDLGIVDRIFPMCYDPSTRNVMAQMARFREKLGTDRVIPGISCFNQKPRSVAAKLKVARELGFEAVALYSYDALFAHRGYRDALQRAL